MTTRNNAKRIILMLHINYAIGHITVAPRNAAVVAGDMMSMECRTDEDFRVRRWELLKVGEGTISVYRHGDQSPYDKEFTHFGAQVTANGSGIIYTNSTRMDDAGLYTCVTRQGPDGKTVRVTAQLMVFESQSVCETNLTVYGNKSLAVGDFIWFRCSVAFRGFWTPTMEWIQRRKNGDIGNILTGGVELVRLPNASVTSTLTIKVDSSMKGVFFSCRTYFTDYEGIQLSLDDTANNIPNFNYTWNSEAVALPNGLVPKTYSIASSHLNYSGILLVVGLPFLILVVIIAVTVFCISKRKRVRDMIQSIKLNRATQEPHSSTELTSGTATQVETEGLEMAATNADYCSLTGVGPAGLSRESKVYCQLRFQNPQNTDYVNIPSNNQSRPSEDAVYYNVAQ